MDSDVNPNLDALQIHLESVYGMRNKESWSSADQKFEILRTILEQGNDVKTMSSSRLPRVVLTRAHNFEMRIAAQTQSLVCNAIGTITPERYVEIVWETVAKIEQEQGITVKVIDIEGLGTITVTFILRLGEFCSSFFIVILIGSDIDGEEFTINYLYLDSLVHPTTISEDLQPVS